MRAIIDGKDVYLNLAATSDPCANQWNEFGECKNGERRAVRAHALPKGVSAGQKFRTNGHTYEIMSM